MEESGVSAAVDRLIQAALDGGGKDNVTVIAIEPEASLEPDAVVARASVMETLFLFADLPFHARLRVGRIVGQRYVADREVIVTAGSAGDQMYVVVQGTVSVRLNGTEVARLGVGEHFGELALVDQEPRSADIVAVGPGYLLSVDRAAFREFCTQEPALGNQMMWKLAHTLGQRLRGANTRLKG
jgi:CRP-like cAMP-binding protein